MHPYDKKYWIYVPPKFINEDEMEYTEVKLWCFFNLTPNSPNTLVLKEEEVYLLQNESQIFDIINEENDSMLGIFEDTEIFDSSVKSIVISRLAQYRVEVKNELILRLLNEILRLLEISYTTNKGIYFMF
ncbi:hypothetical protein DVR12_17585 [Chitinophaga silvatica]|uniref:Uncharacterized protein n=1 Tax=Chitinophaga silvatica TaxID=2282649 RepID=A0A3E1Y7U2_9BACT|nr:hypothetical protein [Chitinophaga silvatica]RFS21147.1 hypothetical protein DVR12_17585 [Chitinophaga silvatica]